MIAEFDLDGPGFAEAVLEVAPVIVLVLDADGRVLHYNDFMARLCGRPLAEVRGRDWFDEFILAEERASVRALFEHALSDAPVRANVNFVRVRDGAPRLIEWHARTLRDASGRVDNVVAIGVDITERVREATERSELAERLELFANSVDEAFFMTNATRDRILYLSPAWERIIGIPRELAYADAAKVGELVHPDDKPQFAASLGAALPEAGRLEQEFRMLRPIPDRPGEHELRWLRIRQSQVQLRADEQPRVVGVVADVTARKQAAHDLEQLGRLFGLFDAAVDDVFLLLNPTRDRVVYASGSIERVFGISRADAYRDFALLLEPIHPDDREAIAATIGQLVPEVGAHYEFRVLTAAGETRWVSARMRSLGPEAELPGAVAVTAMDVTVRHESEAALRRLTEQLEARVAERTRSLELERERLQQIIDGMAEYVCILDPLGRVMQINAKLGGPAARLPESLLGHRVDAIPGLEYGAQSRLDARAALAQAASGEPARFDLETRHHAWFIHDTTLSPICDEQGRVVEIVATAIDVTARRTTERRLRESLAEKEALLHEIHHRVKNNLQVVASLLYLQGVDAAVDSRTVLDECRARIRSMALIHEQLYLSGELAGIEMAEFLDALGRELTQIYAGDRAIRVRVRGGGLVLGIERAVPLALLVNELLTNALKYAYPKLAARRAAEIRVEVTPGAIEIADDGIGLPLGFDQEIGREASGSLGLRLVHTLARQLDAQLEFSSGPGTRVKLLFNLAGA